MAYFKKKLQKLSDLQYSGIIYFFKTKELE